MKTSESIGAWPVLSVWGNAAALASELAPGAVAAVQRIANRAMPKADLTKGDFPRTGWQSRSDREFDPLMRMAHAAAIRNNEIRHAIHESCLPAAARTGGF